MVFVIFIGLNDIDNPTATDDNGKKVALLLSDTVLVQNVSIDLMKVYKKYVFLFVRMALTY